MASPTLSKERKKNDRLSRSLENLRRRAEQAKEQLMMTAVAGGAGFALGMADRKYGGEAILGMSPSLVTGLAAQAAVLLDAVPPEYSGAVQAVGNGALAIVAYREGGFMMSEYMERDRREQAQRQRPQLQPQQRQPQRPQNQRPQNQRPQNQQPSGGGVPRGAAA